MKRWKIIVLLPYVLAVLWVGFWFSELARGGSFGLVGIILYPMLILYGILAAIAYTVILGIALLVRWVVKRRRR